MKPDETLPPTPHESRWKLTLGIVLIAFSFVMSLVFTPLLFGFAGGEEMAGHRTNAAWYAKAAAAMYGASWLVLGAGGLVGGKHAWLQFKHYRERLRNRLLRREK